MLDGYFSYMSATNTKRLCHTQQIRFSKTVFSYKLSNCLSERVSASVHGFTF